MQKPKTKADYSNADLLMVLARFKARFEYALIHGDAEEAERMHRGIVNVEHETRERGWP